MATHEDVDGFLHLLERFVRVSISHAAASSCATMVEDSRELERLREEMHGRLMRMLKGAPDAR